LSKHLLCPRLWYGQRTLPYVVYAGAHGVRGLKLTRGAAEAVLANLRFTYLLFSCATERLSDNRDKQWSGDNFK